MVNVTELNRGPDISANAIDAASVSASESITDPEGNTVTSLSNPVRVTEEASTFAESDLTVVTNNTTEFIDGSTVSRETDDDSFEGDREAGVLINPNTDIPSVEVTISDNTGTNTTASEIFVERASDNVVVFSESSLSLSANDVITLNVRLQSDVTYGIYLNNNNSNYTIGYYSGTINDPYTSSDIDIIGSWDSSVGGANEDPNNIWTISSLTAKKSGGNVRLTTDASTGDALVSFDSGVPADIESWDLATFQRTLDGETVTVDVEDSTGTVLKSDISKDTDISDIATSTDVQFRANLSRQDTANNPTVDYLARRFTR